MVLRTSTRGGAVDRAPTCGTACDLGVRMDVREEAGPSHSGKLPCIAPARAHTRALAVSWPLTRRAKVGAPASAHVRSPTCTFTVRPVRTDHMQPTKRGQRRSGTVSSPPTTEQGCTHVQRWHNPPSPRVCTGAGDGFSDGGDCEGGTHTLFMAAAVRRPTDREEGAGYRIGPRPSTRAVRSGGQKASGVRVLRFPPLRRTDRNV